MEKILSKEAIQQFKKGGFVGKDVLDDLTSTALALYDENAKMRAGIEKLREKWKHNIGVVERDLKWQLENGTNNLTEKNIEITKNELKVLREWVADLASISGKGER